MHLYTYLNIWSARILIDPLCPYHVWSAKCLNWPIVTRAHVPRQCLNWPIVTRAHVPTTGGSGYGLWLDADLRRGSLPASPPVTVARKVLGLPKRCSVGPRLERRELAHALLWGCSYKRLQLAKLLGQLRIFLTLMMSIRYIQYIFSVSRI
jgi:hypothetical protein